MQTVQKHLHAAAREMLSVHLIPSCFPWCSASPTNRRGAFDGIADSRMEVEMTEVISRPHFKKRYRESTSSSLVPEEALCWGDRSVDGGSLGLGITGWRKASTNIHCTLQEPRVSIGSIQVLRFGGKGFFLSRHSFVTPQSLYPLCECGLPRPLLVPYSAVLTFLWWSERLKHDEAKWGVKLLLTSWSYHRKWVIHPQTAVNHG